MRTWLLGGLLAGYVILDVFAIRVWRSEPVLWAHAYRVAPLAQRSAGNHLKFLFTNGHEAEARAIAERLRTAPR